MALQLKKYKPLHWIYNLLHYRSLRHNREAYRALGLKKPLFASVSSADFPDRESRAWLDVEHAQVVASAHPGFAKFDPEVQQRVREWSDKGYLILPKFVEESHVDRINEEVERIVKGGRVRFSHDNKLAFLNKRSSLIEALTKEERLTALLEFILGESVVPFQTLNFIKGSNQRAHSDSIHMTTYPLGFLIAVWIALEDVTMDSGPLFYYPGSHRLPYLLNHDFGNGGNSFSLGRLDYRDYEDRIERLIAEKQLQPEIFLARKGDVLIWHANLIHGGLPIQNRDATRRSMVIHYFAKNVIKYHEITERPSLLD